MRILKKKVIRAWKREVVTYIYWTRSRRTKYWHMFKYMASKHIIYQSFNTLLLKWGFRDASCKEHGPAGISKRLLGSI